MRISVELILGWLANGWTDVINSAFAAVDKAGVRHISPSVYSSQITTPPAPLSGSFPR
jgi:hypothetical protein